MATDAVSPVAQLPPDERGAVGATRALVDDADLSEQFLVRHLARRRTPRRQGVGGESGDLGDQTEVTHAVVGLVVIASGSQSPHRLFGEIDGGLSQGLHIDLRLDFLLEKTFQLALLLFTARRSFARSSALR